MPTSVVFAFHIVITLQAAECFDVSVQIIEKLNREEYDVEFEDGHCKNPSLVTHLLWYSGLLTRSRLQIR